jgi:hypothetical protein
VSINIIEHVESRRVTMGKDPKATLSYRMWGSEDDSEAWTELRLTAPITFEGLWRMSADVTPKSAGFYIGTVEYGLGERQSDKDPSQGGTGSAQSEDSNVAQDSDQLPYEISFDATGQTQHVLYSLATVDSAQRTIDTRGIPDFKQLIGVSKSGVEGCDKVVPGFSWTEVWTFPINTMTWSYIKRVRDLTGTVNNNTFRTFSAREVLFAGATGAHQGVDKYRITYTFRAEKNRDAFRLDADFDPVDKKGWEYFWVSYEESDEDDAITQIPRCVYVERIYDVENFLQLGIGR